MADVALGGAVTAQCRGGHVAHPFRSVLHEDAKRLMETRVAEADAEERLEEAGGGDVPREPLHTLLVSGVGELDHVDQIVADHGAETREGDPAAKVLGELAEEAAARMRLEGVDAEARVVGGAPADALRRLAEEIDADLIVLGKRHGGLYRLLPNSPTDRLIGANRWPVLIAKMGRTGSPLDKRARA